jgi:hypothetical protein
MTTFSASLPATKSSKASSIAFAPSVNPGTGVLTIDVQRSIGEYGVVEFKIDGPGRGFHLAKIEGGSDVEAEFYAVMCGKRPEQDYCDCRGFTRAGHCKHSAAMRVAVDQGWI